MRYLSLGLVLLGLAFAAQAAAPENNAFLHDSDLPNVQIAQFNLDGPVRARSYRLSLSIVPVRTTNNTPFGSAHNSAYQVPPMAERGKEIAWATDDSRKHFFGGQHSISVPLLRLETKGERLELRPRRNSLSIQWTKTLY